MKMSYKYLFAAFVLMMSFVGLASAQYEGVLPQDIASEVYEDEILGTFQGYADMNISQHIKNGTIDWRGVVLVMIGVINMLTKFAGTMAVIFFIYSGARMMLGGISSGSMDTARNHFQWALIGLVVTFMAWVIVNFVIVMMTS